MLQPGHGGGPWWPSKILPLDQHETWFESHYGVKPSIPVHKYLREGGDLIGVFIDECRKHEVAALISPPFVIDRPYLNFRLGGFEIPGRAGLELLVDGKVVRSATGAGGGRMWLMGWDVREHAGKTAPLQIEHGQVWEIASVWGAP